MTPTFVPFDAIWAGIKEVVESAGVAIPADRPVYFVRNLDGQVRLCAPEAAEESHAEPLRRLAAQLNDRLGAHGSSGNGDVLFVSPGLLSDLRTGARIVRPGFHLAERLVTGADWWTVEQKTVARSSVRRCALYSVKGGVGRSTTAAVLAWHLAVHGQRVLIVDVDLESPGLSSAMLDAKARPVFGVTDWFVEELVGQGDHVVANMTAAPAWARNLEGDVRIAPAHGREPGEYLAKLGRVYRDSSEEAWTARLGRLLSSLESACDTTLVILESRSGLHDIAAATVTDLDARVLLFATDSDSTWTDYEILFRHWRRQGLAPSIRKRLAIVSALTPDWDAAYLPVFRERSWDLFRIVYDELDSSAEDAFSFDLADDEAPHQPLVVHWTRTLAASRSLRDPGRAGAAAEAYAGFLTRFDRFLDVGRVGGTR